MGKRWVINVRLAEGRGWSDDQGWGGDQGWGVNRRLRRWGQEFEESQSQFGNGCEAVVRRLLQTAVDDVLQGRGRLWARCSERARVFANDLPLHLGDGAPLEGEHSGERFVKDDTERPHVGSFVDDRGVLCLFG